MVPPSPGPDDLSPPAEAPSRAPTLEAVYRAHASWVARLAGRLGGPGLDVDDLVHDVFLIVRQRLPSYDPARAAITSWLWGITANVVRKRRRSANLRRWLFSGNSETTAQVPAGTASPLEDLQRAEASALVYRVLDGMSDKLRTALMLFELEGMSGEEIAAITGQKVGTVWVTLHRARAQFLARARAIDETRPVAKPEGEGL